MAKRKASASFKLFGAQKNPIGTAIFTGKSVKEAERIGTRALKNIAEGFYDKKGIFHPIRHSADYSPAAAGETGRKKRKKKTTAKKRKPARKAARKPVRKAAKRRTAPKRRPAPKRKRTAKKRKR